MLLKGWLKGQCSKGPFGIWEHINNCQNVKKNIALGNVDKLQCDSIASIWFLYTRTMVGKDIGWNSYEYISVQFWSFSYTSFLTIIPLYFYTLSLIFSEAPPYEFISKNTFLYLIKTASLYALLCSIPTFVICRCFMVLMWLCFPFWGALGPLVAG